MNTIEDHTWPSAEDIMQAVCTSMSTSAEVHGIYTLAVAKRALPVSPRDISERVEKHPPHVDARAMSCFIYRYHTLMPIGYDNMQPPNDNAVARAFGIKREYAWRYIRTLCGLLNCDERYRRIYTRSLILLKEAGKSLSSVPKDIRSLTTPCQ